MKKIITYLIIVVALAGAGYFVWLDMTNISEIEEGNTVANEDLSNEGVVNNDSDKSEEDNVQEISFNIPDFKKIFIDNSIGNTDKLKLTADIQDVITSLESNVMNPTAWTQLGILRQSAKDYEGAIKAWEFAHTLSDQNAIPLLNIANTYGYYLHDNAKAEEYFKKAITAEPKNGYAYFKAYEFYTDINEGAKARAVIEQGVAANPTDKQLEAVLNALK